MRAIWRYEGNENGDMRRNRSETYSHTSGNLMSRKIKSGEKNWNA